MSGDSTFGNSNIAAASMSSDSDEIEPLEAEHLSNEASANSQSTNDEWDKSNAARIAKLIENFGDSVNESLAELPAPKGFAQRRLARNKNAAETARKAVEHFNLSDDSIDAVEQQFRSRRRPFSRNQNQPDPEKKLKEAAALDVATSDSEGEKIVYKKPLPFSKRRASKNAEKQFAKNVNQFDVTDSSIEERRPRVTRGFSKKRSVKSKAEVNPSYFDITDESLVGNKPPVKESTKSRFSRATRGRKVTEADINAFDVTDDDEEGKGEENKADENQGEENGGDDDLVLEMDEEGKDNEEEEASNSMDESADDAECDKERTLEIHSPEEDADGEDSLDEEVDEERIESRKSDRNVSNKEEKGGGEGQNNIVAEGGSCNEQSSLDLEYHLSTDNHSESRAVAESHNKSPSLVSNASMTVDFTMASRRSRSKRFEQNGSPFLEVVQEKSTDVDLPNLGKSFNTISNVLNVSANPAKQSLSPVELENLSPTKAVPDNSSSDSNNRSLPSRNNSVNKSQLASGKRSSASKELFSDSRTSSSGKDKSGNNSKQNLNDSIGVSDGSMQPLNVEEEGGEEMNRSLRSGKDLVRRSNTKDNSSNEKNKSSNASKQMNKSREDLMNDSVTSNRSLRSRTRAESNKSIIDDVDSQKNGESGAELFMEDESQQEVDEMVAINRSLRNRTGNGNSSKSMSEKEGSKENSKSGNDSINDTQKEEERVNSRSLRKRGRGVMNKSITEKESSKENVDVIDESKQGVNEADGINRSLRDRSAVKRLLNQSVTEDQTSKQRGKELSNKSITEEGSSKENCNDVINDAQEADEERPNERSLRNRSATKGKSSNSVTGDRNSKRNFDDSMNSVHNSLGFVSNARTTRRARLTASEESSPDDNSENVNDSLRSSVETNNRSLRSRSKNNSGAIGQVSPGFGRAGAGEDSPDAGSGETDDRMARSSNGVTYSSEEIVGHKRGQGSKGQGSSLYNSLDSFGEGHSRSVSMLLIPERVNESAVIDHNNSLDSTVNVTRQNAINQSSDEIMPAPRSLPARKRRLANGDTPSFSSLAQKKKKNVAGETDSIIALVEKQNDQVATNNNREVVGTKVDYKCPKLKKPEPWVTTVLYNWIIERLEPRYELRSRLRAEQFVVLLCSTVKTVIKKEANYEKDIEDLKYEMARLNLIENLHHFFRFISRFLPWQFQDKSLPLPQACIEGPVVTFEKGTLYDPIL